MKASRITSIIAVAAALAACGGGGVSGDPSAEPAEASTALSAAGDGDAPRAQALAAGVAPAAATTLTVRARGTLAAGVGPVMAVRIDGVQIGTVEVRSTSYADYAFPVTTLRAGSKVDIVFTNDAYTGGQDRNLYIAHVHDGNLAVVPYASAVVYDRGAGAKAYDGVDTVPGRFDLNGNGALRFPWPSAPATTAKQYDASRFLQQATFGATQADVLRLAQTTKEAWLAEQMALPYQPDFVSYIQGKYRLGDAWRPGGSQYTPAWNVERFWATAARSPDQLRKRVAYALHQIIMVSQTEANLWMHARAYANYVDSLNKHAFGNFRDLLEDIALSPAMGIYLSHMRNRQEDTSEGRFPDENFAREVMQLFSIGLHQLNIDGTEKLGSNGLPIETYGNADVMALAKVFTGWSWALPDNQMSEHQFRWGGPDYSAAKDQQIDLKPMRPYPGMYSTAEKRLFAGTAQAVVIPANTSPQESLKLALDALFKHPNVGPFIGRQLIQRLVSSNPSPAYVARVASVFNNNGKGVRGDLAAIVRAVLLDPEAVSPPASSLGRIREPVLRTTQWMRAFQATSTSGEYRMSHELSVLGQQPLYASSVFGYYRPGYVQPNSELSNPNATTPELQIVNESTVASWVNQAETMVLYGLGVNGASKDVTASLASQAALLSGGNVNALIDQLNLLLFGGRMPSAVKVDMLNAMAGVSGTTADSHLLRARTATFVALTSPEYMLQR